MKYSELISFNPIEDIIQLTTANDDNKAKEYVKSYVMSDQMAENLKAPVIEQLQMDEVVDNHGVLIVGNYGTGKSHLMSVISAIASNADDLQYLQNKKFADEMQCIAGKFEVLRMEIGGVTMSLRDIIFGYIEDDFVARGISYTAPDLDKVRDNKKLVTDMMLTFNEKYPGKGYLIVIDELLGYLSSRNEKQIVLDLEFLRALGEMCSKSRLRIICGLQEKIFDNPRFSFVSDTLKHVSDRFTQLLITKEDTAFVVSERILKKTPEQKAWIRQHLEKFSSLYGGMSSKMDQFVNLFPIHPSYIDVFNQVYLVENRQILKNISLTIRDIFDEQVPEDKPGIYSFDTYWPAIKSNGLLKSDVTIRRVVDASMQLEDIIDRAFPKSVYKPLAIQIIYALSVHRLTTNGLDVQFGLSAETLKDDLCLFLTMPEQDPEFLLGIIRTTLKDIMMTVSGQFIVYNDNNGQYYIDVNKVVDYDEKINQKASIMAPGEWNRYFYEVVYGCMEWDQKQYVPGFEIYQYDLNWESHNIFREGYLFMGIPEERSTAQPERDFYIHFMPPYDSKTDHVQNLNDEVYFYFKPVQEFDENMQLYAAASAMADESEGKDKDAYLTKKATLKKKLVRYLSENKNTCFNVVYHQNRRQLIEVLRGKHRQDSTFKDTIDLTASVCFDEYFDGKYPEFPVFRTKITRKNMAENVRAAFDYFAGRKNSQVAVALLKTFGVLDDQDRIKPEGSKYAGYYIDLLKKLPQQGVLNYGDLFEYKFNWPDSNEFEDKHFKISMIFTPIIFLAMVYGGYAVISLKDGKTQITASALDQVPKTGVFELYEFKYLSKPAEASLAELKKLFEILDINPVYLDNPNDREKSINLLLKKAQELSNSAVMGGSKIETSFDLWGEPMANSQLISQMSNACKAVKDEFTNYGVKYNTPAKLNNFSHTMEEVGELEKQIKIMMTVPEYLTFKNECSDIITYLSKIENDELDDDFMKQITDGKEQFRKIRDSIANGTKGDAAAHQVDSALSRIKSAYIDLYFDEHKQKRLDIKEAKKRGELQESQALANLRKLRDADENKKVLSLVKLQAIEQDLAELVTCYELTPEELKHDPVCPHCHYQIGSKSKNVYGQLDNLEQRINDLLIEWTGMLLNTITDPIVLSQKTYLKKKQAEVIDQFVETKKLPKKVDDFFVQSIKDLLKGFDPVVIDTDELMSKLDEIGPCDVTTFEAKIKSLIAGYIKDKDPSKLRIVVKRKDSEA